MSRYLLLALLWSLAPGSALAAEGAEEPGDERGLSFTLGIQALGGPASPRLGVLSAAYALRRLRFRVDLAGRDRVMSSTMVATAAVGPNGLDEDSWLVHSRFSLASLAEFPLTKSQCVDCWRGGPSLVAGWETSVAEGFNPAQHDFASDRPRPGSLVPLVSPIVGGGARVTSPEGLLFTVDLMLRWWSGEAVQRTPGTYVGMLVVPSITMGVGFAL